MKYLLIIGDGMADNPVDALGGKTPLEVAHIPNMDALAAHGQMGSVVNCPKGLPPGSDTAILSIFGCDPRTCYTGRAPLEAAATGIALNPGDAAYRCNMVSYEDTDLPLEQRRILSHNAGSIEGDLSDTLIKALFEDPDFRQAAEQAGVCVYPGNSFRHIAVQRSAQLAGIRLLPPHDHLGEVVGPLLPSGCPNANTLRDLMLRAHRFLNHHPLNEARRTQGKLPANGIWFWAEGTAVALPSFPDTYGTGGGVISAVPLCHGIAVLTGLEPVTVPGATGELETNYEGKAQAALDTLERWDFAAVHVEAPDECTHNGDTPGKIQAIEWLDSRVLAPLLQGLAQRGWDYRMLILSDHKTLTSTRGHDGDPVPYLLYDSSRPLSGGGDTYSERAGKAGPFVPDGTALMSLLFDK